MTFWDESASAGGRLSFMNDDSPPSLALMLVLLLAIGLTGGVLVGYLCLYAIELVLMQL